MAEGGVGTCPQVFVVDSRANFMSVSSGKKSWWARAGKNLLLVLVGVTVFGLVVEGCLIYNLHQKMEAFSMSKPPLCQNLSSPTQGQQESTLMKLRGLNESNKISREGFIRGPQPVQRQPFAHLIGSSSPGGENNILRWLHDGGDSVIYNMRYDDGMLVVEKPGYYYLYSKVTLNVAEECSLDRHRVLKETKAYALPIELMRSKSIHCQNPRSPAGQTTPGEDLWNSFLAGIYYLHGGDKVYVTLDNIQKMRPGPTDNMMGALMIFP